MIPPNIQQPASEIHLQRVLVLLNEDIKFYGGFKQCALGKDEYSHSMWRL